MENDVLSPAGIEYHGMAGASRECLAAVMNLIQTHTPKAGIEPA